MLLTMRVPVVDMRPFGWPDYPDDIRLPATWSEDDDFVRYFGPVRKRMKGPVDPWASERAFCVCDRVLRFPPSYPAVLAGEVPGLQFYGIKRRLYPANNRNDLFHVDVQIVGRSRWFSLPAGAPFRHYRPAQFDLVTTVKAVLNAPTTIWWPGGKSTNQPMGLLGSPIAKALDAATTVGERSGKVFAGAPAVTIEIDEVDLALAKWCGEWNLGEGLRLLAKPVVFEGRTINVFVVSRPTRVHRDRARALRIHTLRLHAERVYLRRMARLLAPQGFLDGCDHQQVERIQNALNQCLAALTRARSAGFSNLEITTAFVADRALTGSELEVLVERVHNFRPIITKRLQQLRDIDDVAEERARRLLERYPDVKNFTYIREVRMSHYDQRNSQIGAAGDHASATNFSFGGRLNLEAMSASDSEALQSALRTLRKHLADQLIADAVIDVDSEEFSPIQIGSAIGALSEAEEAIAAKDQQRAESALRRSGRWLASFAQQVGVLLAAAAIQAALKLP